jgi:low affinity Fe/Cu permease
LTDFFRRAAHKVILLAGSWQLFVLSIVLLLIWGLSGPVFGFSDAWQLVVNTSTTILTYLLGILILLEANRQSKESKVVHDELIKAVRGARNELINIDQMSEKEIDLLEARLRRRGRAGATPHRPGRKGAGR